MMYRVGIDVGGTNLKASLIDETGTLMATRCRPLRWEGQEELTKVLVELADAVVLEAGITRAEVSSVGMGFPGVVDHRRGLVVHTTNVPIDNMPVVRMFHSDWQVPVHLGNDADCAALGEFYHSGDQEIDSFILVTLGTGVGTGLILNGKIWCGHNGYAAEGGHIVIVHNGEQCPCGRRGCWERYASATALIRQTRSAMERCRDSLMWDLVHEDLEKVDGRTAFAAMEAGDEAARVVVEQYICYLAEGMTNLINLLQPDVIALGGGVSQAREESLLLPLRQKVREIAYDQMAKRHTEIVTAKLGNDAGIIGAALLGR